MKKSLVSEVLIWILAGMITLVGIGGVSLAFGVKAISYETFISWGVYMITAFMMRNIMGTKGTWKGKTIDTFIVWKNRVVDVYNIIRNKMTFKQKKLFTIDADKREKENRITQLLQSKSVDNYFYDKILKDSKKDKNTKTIKQLVKDEIDLNRKQKRMLIRVLENKLHIGFFIFKSKLKPHSVNELNSTFESRANKVYDLKDHTRRAKIKDTGVWLAMASMIFLALSSIIISGSQYFWLAVTQGAITLASLGWNGFNSYVKHISYITTERVSYFQQKHSFGLDACKFNNIEVAVELEEVKYETEIKESNTVSKTEDKTVNTVS